MAAVGFFVALFPSFFGLLFLGEVLGSSPAGGVLLVGEGVVVLLLLLLLLSMMKE